MVNSYKLYPWLHGYVNYGCDAIEAIEILEATVDLYLNFCDNWKISIQIKKCQNSQVTYT